MINWLDCVSHIYLHLHPRRSAPAFVHTPEMDPGWDLASFARGHANNCRMHTSGPFKKSVISHFIYDCVRGSVCYRHRHHTRVFFPTQPSFNYSITDLVCVNEQVREMNASLHCVVFMPECKWVRVWFHNWFGGWLLGVRMSAIPSIETTHPPQGSLHKHSCTQ